MSSECPDTNTECTGCHSGPPTCQLQMGSTTPQPHNELGEVCSQEQCYMLVFRHHNHWRIRGLLLWNWSLCWSTESKWFIMVLLAWHATRPTGAHTVRVGGMWRVWPLLQGLLCHLCQWFLEPEPPPAGGEGRSYQLGVSLWLGAHGGTVLFL